MRLNLVPEGNWNKIVLTKDECYTNCPQNGHHWTTRYVWEKFMPMLATELGIRFDSNDF